MKRAIIVGATSGIGKEVAILLLKEGWRIGIAGRRKEALENIQSMYPKQVEIETIDIIQDDAAQRLNSLIDKVGGMNLYFHSSGVGSQNKTLNPEIEINTARTNVEGFTRMVDAAFNYFKNHRGGHIAVISSIAGTKGIGLAPAYSATKRFQNTYIEALAQLANMEKLNIHFTDIRPGFVATELLKDRNYPMLMKADTVAADIINALKHKKRIRIIDGRFRLLVFFWRLIPRCLWEKISIKNRKK